MCLSLSEARPSDLAKPSQLTDLARPSDLARPRMLTSDPTEDADDRKVRLIKQDNDGHDGRDDHVGEKLDSNSKTGRVALSKPPDLTNASSGRDGARPGPLALTSRLTGLGAASSEPRSPAAAGGKTGEEARMDHQERKRRHKDARMGANVSLGSI